MRKLLILGSIVLTLAALGCQTQEPDPTPPANSAGKGVSSGSQKPGTGAAPQPATN